LTLWWLERVMSWPCILTVVWIVFAANFSHNAMQKLGVYFHGAFAWKLVKFAVKNCTLVVTLNICMPTEFSAPSVSFGVWSWGCPRKLPLPQMKLYNCCLFHLPHLHSLAWPTCSSVQCSLVMIWLCDDLTVWRVDCEKTRLWREDPWRADRVMTWPCDELTYSQNTYMQALLIINP